VLRLTDGRGVDAAFDTVGGTTVSRSIKAVRAYGKLATVVSLEGPLGGMQPKNLTLYFGFMERTEAKIHAMATLVSRGQLRPLIDSVFPLEQVAAAQTKLEAGGIKGKVVIRI
jgi:NADPH2:quinone reductase